MIHHALPRGEGQLPWRETEQIPQIADAFPDAPLKEFELEEQDR